MSADSLRAQIREVPDFPKPGILFYDITTLLNDADAFRESIELMNEPFKDDKIDVVVGMESRGFIFSAPMALHLGAGFVPVRKLGKLPAETISVEYELEYGTNTLEVHRDAIKPGQRVLIVDDLLATGGTVLGTIDLVKQLKGEIVGLSLSRVFREGPYQAARLLHVQSTRHDPEIYAWMASETSRHLAASGVHWIEARSTCPMIVNAFEAIGYMKGKSFPVYWWPGNHEDLDSSIFVNGMRGEEALMPYPA